MNLWIYPSKWSTCTLYTCSGYLKPRFASNATTYAAAWTRMKQCHVHSAHHPDLRTGEVRPVNAQAPPTASRDLGRREISYDEASQRGG